MFFAAQFTIAKLWKQPRCPTTKEWGLRKCGIYTKKKEILSFTRKWMELENIILSKVSQTQTAKNHMFSLIYRLQTENKCSNTIGHWSYTKWRTHTGIKKGKET
jgi:hypothetical protein